MPKIREGHTSQDVQEHFRFVCINHGLCSYCNVAQWNAMFQFLVDPNVRSEEFIRMVWLMSIDLSYDFVSATLRGNKVV